MHTLRGKNTASNGNPMAPATPGGELEKAIATDKDIVFKLGMDRMHHWEYIKKHPIHLNRDMSTTLIRADDFTGGGSRVVEEGVREEVESGFATVVLNYWHPDDSTFITINRNFKHVDPFQDRAELPGLVDLTQLQGLEGLPSLTQMKPVEYFPGPTSLRLREATDPV